MSAVPRHSPQARLPRQLFGYDVLDYIGSGAGSTIYAVSRPDDAQVYALKHVVIADKRSTRFLEQLEAEHRVASCLQHAGLRRSVDFCTNASFFRRASEAALVMELVDGSPIMESACTDPGPLVDIFAQTAEAIAALHEMLLVHCDLKPANVLITSQGAAKIIDFGQTCPMGTAKDRIQGTPDFIAPEQVRCEPVDARTDVYNLGATMYAAFTGKRIATLFTLEKRNAGGNNFFMDTSIEPAHAVNPALPEMLGRLIADCIRTAPEKRPQQMRDVARRLQVVRHMLSPRDHSQLDQAV